MQIMSKRNLFNQLLEKNNILEVNQNQSVKTLVQQMAETSYTTLLVRHQNSMAIYKGDDYFSGLLTGYDPRKKIKTFLDFNTDKLPQPIMIRFDSGNEDQVYAKLDRLFADLNRQGRGMEAQDFDSEPGMAEGSEVNESDSGTRGSRSAPREKDSSTGPGEQPKPYFIKSEFEDLVAANSLLPINVCLSKEPGKKASKPLTLKENWQIDILVFPIAGLDLEGPYIQSVIVKEENLDKPLRFTLKTRTAGDGRFVITARYQGLELFHQEYTVTIRDNMATGTTRPFTHSVTVQGKPQRNAPDLTLLIEQGTDNNGLLLQYTLYSPDKSLNLHYKKYETSIAQKDVGTYFREFFEDIDGIKQDTKEQRLNAVDMLKGKGAALYRDLFPGELRQKFWQIRESIHTIAINSDEPWIPWEICYLYPEETGVDDPNAKFFCEAYEISRWISGAQLQDGPLSLAKAAFVIPSDSQLTFTRKELRQIEEALAKTNTETVEIPATYRELRKSFASGGHNIWHFSGHGTDSQGTNTNRYKIILEGGDNFSPQDITGLKSIGAGKPIIFFNACHASRPGLGLTGLSGWPKEFIENNAAAFIGAYWSVFDETACQFSVKFYELLANGESIASAMKNARLHVKNAGDPTWLAYTLYADPFARISQ